MVRIPRGMGIFEEKLDHTIGMGLRGNLMKQLSVTSDKGLNDPLLQKLEESNQARDDKFRV